MARTDPRWTNQDIAVYYLYHLYVGAVRDDSLPEIMNPRDPTKELKPERTEQVDAILRATYADLAKECEDYLVGRGLMQRGGKVEAGSGITLSRAIPHTDGLRAPVPSLVGAVQSTR